MISTIIRTGIIVCNCMHKPVVYEQLRHRMILIQCSIACQIKTMFKMYDTHHMLRYINANVYLDKRAFVYTYCIVIGSVKPDARIDINILLVISKSKHRLKSKYFWKATVDSRQYNRTDTFCMY